MEEGAVFIELYMDGSWSESTERENATLVCITADRFLPTEDIVATEMIFLLSQQLY